MSWLAVWLIAVGVVDLARTMLPRRVTWGAPVLGVVTVLVVALLTDLTAVVDAVALVLALAPLIGWWWFADQGLTATGRRDHVLALLCLGGGAAALVAVAGDASPVGGWFGTWLDWARPPLASGHDPQRVLLVVGLLLANLATGNVVVRLVLVAVGALRPGRSGHSQRTGFAAAGCSGRSNGSSLSASASPVSSPRQASSLPPRDCYVSLSCRVRAAMGRARSVVSGSTRSRNTSSSAASFRGSSRWGAWR